MRQSWLYLTIPHQVQVYCSINYACLRQENHPNPGQPASPLALRCAEGLHAGLTRARGDWPASIPAVAPAPDLGILACGVAPIAVDHSAVKSGASLPFQRTRNLPRTGLRAAEQALMPQLASILLFLPIRPRLLAPSGIASCFLPAQHHRQ
jgi:hypothetical protein